MDKYTEALLFAIRAHDGQRRKYTDEPYICHPIRVAANFKSNNLKMIALLHDVVEDTDRSLNDIFNIFGKEVGYPVDCITRRTDEPYFDYIHRVESNHSARRVKIEDLKDNLNGLKLPGLVNKYEKALEILES